MAENKISMEEKAKLGELFATAIEKGELSEADMENVAGGLSETTKKRLAKGAAAIATAAAVAGVIFGKREWDKRHPKSAPASAPVLTYDENRESYENDEDAVFE